MSAGIYQLCRVYEDTLLAVLETFGERPFTAADLREKGIEFPGGRTHIFFWRAGLIRRHQFGRPSSWVLSQMCIDYLTRRKEAETA